MLNLRILDSAGRQIIRLDDAAAEAPTVIGSGPSANVRVLGNGVFGRHCAIFRSRGLWLLQDGNTSGRTRVNDVTLANSRQACPIAPGDVIQLGGAPPSVHIEVETVGAPSHRRPAAPSPARAGTAGNRQKNFPTLGAIEARRRRKWRRQGIPALAGALLAACLVALGAWALLRHGGGDTPRLGHRALPSQEHRSTPAPLLDTARPDPDELRLVNDAAPPGDQQPPTPPGESERPADSHAPPATTPREPDSDHSDTPDPHLPEAGAATAVDPAGIPGRIGPLDPDHRDRATDAWRRVVEAHRTERPGQRLLAYEQFERSPVHGALIQHVRGWRSELLDRLWWERIAQLLIEEAALLDRQAELAAASRAGGFGGGSDEVMAELRQVRNRLAAIAEELALIYAYDEGEIPRLDDAEQMARLRAARDEPAFARWREQVLIHLRANEGRLPWEGGSQDHPAARGGDDPALTPPPGLIPSRHGPFRHVPSNRFRTCSGRRGVCRRLLRAGARSVGAADRPGSGARDAAGPQPGVHGRTVALDGRPGAAA